MKFPTVIPITTDTTSAFSGTCNDNHFITTAYVTFFTKLPNNFFSSKKIVLNLKL